MSTMIVEVYEAFKAANVSDEKAQAAAKALADYENRFNKLEAETTLIKWMVGFNITLTIGIIVKLFAVA